MMINSPPLHSNSNKRLRFSIPRNKNNDLLINSTTEKFEDINNNNHYQEEKNSIDCNNTMKQEILVSNNNNNNNNKNNENDTTLLTTTTTTTVEFKVKTTKTSSRKRKSNIINDINHDNINKEQLVSKKKKNSRMTKIDDELNNDHKKKSNSNTNDQSSSTDESSFGSCEPGTNVVLQGIVWNETDKGVLVVNITWRGKTYVGALLNTTEQNWAPPRYKSDIRSSIKQNHNRDHQLPSTYETTERILRNGKRRCSTTATTVIPNSTTKINSFKMPEIPPTTKIDDNRKIIEKLIIPSSLSSSSSSSSNNNHDEDEINEEKNLIKNLNVNGDDEIGDNYSSRSISPITSGTSTTSSSPLLSNNIENQTSIPIDLSNSKIIMNMEQNKSNSIAQQTSNDTLIPYHFTNDILYSTSTNSSDYFSSLQNSTNPFNLASFNKSSSSYHSIPTQVYLNTSNYSSLSKSSH
ncbi:unnamed protein product [Rotaria sordida]|uniref:Uncharacterized protein n=1 Tax=Rotaria sordida TaxID=392033 RepID=A0A814JLQ4_9BILA|nr:unnamed protein product [Rotaria sordida]CAF3637810.1 unnamed protein product [Rotaria sordida]